MQSRFISQSRSLLPFLLLLISLASGIACNEKEAEPVVVNVVPVEVITATTQALAKKVVLTGFLEAYRSVDIASETSGETMAIIRDVGDHVEANDRLSLVDDAVARESLNQAEAGFSSAEAQYQITFNDFQRDSTLFAHGDIAQALFDNSRLLYTSAAAGLKNARATRKLAARQLAKTTIRAPFPGIISRRFCELGSFVSPGVPIFHLVDIDSLRLRLGVSHHNLTRLVKGREVVISNDALVGRTFTGRIRSISPEADPQTHTFSVEIIIANPPDLPLRDGLVIQAALQLDEIDQVITVPRETIIYRGDDAYLFVINNNIARRQPIRVGAMIDGNFVVERGLSIGDTIVTVGMQNLNDGDQVHIETSTSKSVSTKEQVS